MKILFVEPHESSLFSFRKELLDTLIGEGHQLILCTEATQKTKDEYLGKVFKIINIKINLKTKNIFSNLRLKKFYKKVIKENVPDLIVSYKVKPNIYCGLYCKNIPMIANITGLGNIFKSNGILSKIGLFLYKKSFKNVKYVFFQNLDGLAFFKKHNLPLNNYKIIPGSGVNINKFSLTPIVKSNTINFLFASRAIKEKGFDLLVDAIPMVLEKHTNVHFNILSAEEDVYANKKANELFKHYSKNITILKRTDDMNEVYAQNDFLVSPSYYREGISNVLLESLACGRPIITTKDNSGCKECLIENVNGLGICSKNLESLVNALNLASSMDKNHIEEMGFNGREFVIKNFDRNIVISEYLNIINNIK